VWSTFDNATRTARRIGETSDITTRLRAPAGLDRRDGTFIKIELSAIDALQPSWETPVDAYFGSRDGHWYLAGFERMGER